MLNPNVAQAPRAYKRLVFLCEANLVNFEFSNSRSLAYAKDVFNQLWHRENFFLKQGCQNASTQENHSFGKRPW